jgi:hypothetical protein
MKLPKPSAPRPTSSHLKKVAAWLSALLMAATAPGFAAEGLVVNNAPDTSEESALALANVIKGTGIQSFSNVTLTGKIGAGTTKGSGSSSAGTFGGGEGIIGIKQGVVLSSGGVQDVVGPNSSPSITQANGTGGDAHLAALIDAPVETLNDKTVMEFDFVPTYPTIAFRYVFSSDEYWEYANSDFNDVFGFFVNGTAPENNIARIPGTTLPVSINNVNGGNPLGTSAQNPQYYLNNVPPVFNVEMDGMTVVLTAQTAVNPGQVNHIKIAIADVIDESYDSNVFIEQSSFVSGNAPIAVNDGYKTPVNTPLTVIDSGVLANDSDLDNNLQRAQLVTPPASGNLSLNAAGGFTYTPEANFTGDVTFTYIAVDATHIQSPPATVTINVGASNSIPTGATSTVTVAKNAVSPLPLSGFTFSDSDPGNSLTAIKIHSLSLPANSTLQVAGLDVALGQLVPAVIIGNGGLKFTPAPGAAGPSYASFTYQVSDGSALSAAHTMVINVSNLSPEIEVRGNGAVIATGDSTPSAADHTDFGKVNPANGTRNRTFTVANIGNAPLTVESVMVTGPHAADFDVTIQPATSVTAGNFTTFTVQFDPSGSGFRNATVNFLNSDGDESPFTFAIQGFGGVISDDGSLSNIVLSTGTLSPAFSPGSFGYSAAVPNAVATITLTATTADPWATVRVNGGPAASGVPSIPINLAIGSNTITVVVTSESGLVTQTYTIVVTRLASASGEIVVEQPSKNSLTSGAAIVDFGASAVGQSATKTFIVKNIALTPLTLMGATVTGGNAADFAVDTTSLASTLSSNGSQTTFKVTYTPSAATAGATTLQIQNSDADEGIFEVALTGSGTSGPTSIFSIGAEQFTIGEEDGVLLVPVIRSGSLAGAASITISTVNDSAVAPHDFTALSGLVVNFADGVALQNVPVSIVADTNNLELNEVFRMRLSAPSTGAAIGAVNTAAVTIIEPDTTIPTVTIVSPAQNMRLPEGPVMISGGAKDNKGVSRVEVSLNGGAYVEATLIIPDTGTTNGMIANFEAPISPVGGVNVLNARSVDHRGNVSLIASRTFTYVVLRPLTLNIIPAEGGTCSITPSPVNGQAELGVVYTLKASAKPGYFWQAWTAPGVSGAAAGNATLSITMTNGLVVDANFVPNLFSAGAYNGLAAATAGTTPAVSNFGYVSGTMTSAGSLSAKVNFAGDLQSFTAVFDKVTGAASGDNGSGLTYNLQLDVSGTREKITGTVTQTATNESSNVQMSFNPYSLTNKVDDRYLKDGDNTKNGIYNVIFPALPSQNGLTFSDYPQGDGYGTVTVTPAGSVSISGVLADGTTVTGNAPFWRTYQWPLAVTIKASATAPGTTLGGLVQFDTTQPDTDASATTITWFRTARAGSTYYPNGWPSGIATALIGAKYNAPSGAAALPNLAPTDLSGNALLQISDGLLASSFTRFLNISTSNTVAKIPATDTTYTLTITPTTGILGGNFLHTGSATIRPVLRGMILQKGANAGGYGFFLSPVATGSTTPGESGGFTLSPRPSGS